jgi:hypothetical protein
MGVTTVTGVTRYGRFTIPKIVSAGPPPEKHADRVVAEMLRLIKADLVRLIRESGGRLLFDVILEPGKRGRYELILTESIGWNAAIGTAIHDTHPIPEKPWLGCRLTRIKSKGRGCYEVSRNTPLLITHHALSRLAQRSNAREAIDLVLAVRASSI